MLLLRFVKVFLNQVEGRSKERQSLGLIQRQWKTWNKEDFIALIKPMQVPTQMEFSLAVIPL